MVHLDQSLAKVENPPFDRLARLYVDLTGPLDGPAILTLSVTTLAGNGKQESAKRRLERSSIAKREELEARVKWVLGVTGTRSLLPPKIDEVYEASPLGYDGPIRVFGTELDCRLDAAKALVSPQVLVELAASFIPADHGASAACFARARFQGMLVTPHIIEVKLFDTDLDGDADDRWTALKTWAARSAGNNRCSLGT